MSHPVRAARRAVVDLAQESERETARVRLTRPPWRVDGEACVVLLTVVGVILSIRYYGLSSRSGWLADGLDLIGLDGLSARVDEALQTSPNRTFNRRVYWAVFRIVAYTAPVLVVGRLVLHKRLDQLGGGIDWSWKHIRPYVGLYLLMLPLVIIASTDGAFQAQYPLYDPGDAGLWPRFVVWQLLYLGQFLALELFFRGFTVFGLAPRFGIMAIPVMVVPYVAIHLTKPFAEAVASIVAGTVLGFLALRSGVVWWGAFLHFAVALTIDVLTL